MEINFKYYKSGSLISSIVVCYILLGIILSYTKEYMEIGDNWAIIFDLIGLASPLLLVSIFLFVVNKWGWKYKVFSWLVDIPNLNGRYKGKLISSFKDQQGNPIEKECVIEIKQTASYLAVNSYYADSGNTKTTSEAKSLCFDIVKERDDSFVIRYIFTNEPDNMQSVLEAHDGTTKFKYFPDIKALKGEYYNHRQNKGQIEVTFESPTLKFRF